MALNLKTLSIEVVINIANIIILFVILRLLVYKPVKKFMDARSGRIEQALQAAQQKHDEAERQRNDMSQTLAQMEKDAAVKLQEKQAAALSQADAIIGGAKQEAGVIISAARHQAEQEHKRALADLKDDVAEMAVSIAEKLLAREMQQKDNEALVDSFFDEVK